jgi:predicted transcriptional regulator
MSHKPRADAQAKTTRALELINKGLSPAIIAERLGVTQMYVYELINKARARHEQEAPQT